MNRLPVVLLAAARALHHVSMLRGLGLASITDSGKRTAYPVNLHLQIRF